MAPRLRARIRWMAATAAAVLLVVQLVPVDRTNPPVRSEIDAPDEVRVILRRSCYDCHSHETRWRWYSYVAPLSWWIAHHVHEARDELNFSDWPALDVELQSFALRDIEEQIDRGAMPLPSYLLFHRDARLSDADRDVLLRWAGTRSRDRSGS